MSTFPVNEPPLRNYLNLSLPVQFLPLFVYIHALECPSNISVDVIDEWRDKKRELEEGVLNKC